MRVKTATVRKNTRLVYNYSYHYFMVFYGKVCTNNYDRTGIKILRLII